MCGLAGVLSVEPRPEWADVARRMQAMLLHRGPDSRGLWSDETGRVHLAHTRLAIQDLSPAGAQPMASSCGRYTVVLNGEIYNHFELRRAFGAGRRWRGQSDTETMVELIARAGFQAALEQANGMFAVAVWDRVDEVLLLARDRIGEKPLYWGELGGVCVFSSELAPILRSGLGPFEIDLDAVEALLNLGYVPDPLCIVQPIRKLAPGSWLEVRPCGGSLDVREGAYWSLEAVARDASGAPEGRTEEAWMERVEAALRASVEARLISDVPIGAFLSGGVDSGLIVALMAEVAPEPVRTFTIAMPGQGDESPRARALAEHLGTEHMEIPITEAECLEVVPSLPRIYSEPLGDSSQVPTAVVSREARRHVTVVLTGDGGDELFAGYHRHFAAQAIWKRLQRTPLGPRRLAERWLNSGPGRAAAGRAIRLLTRDGRAVRRHLKLHKGLSLVGAGSAREVYERLVVQWPGGLAPIRTREPWNPTLPDWVDGLDRVSPAGRFALYDLLEALPGDMLVKVDRASMAVALEVRVPFLDHELLALALRVPQPLKVSGGQGKVILRKLLAGKAPTGWMDAPEARRKAGFGIPIATWLRGDLRDWAEDLLSDTSLSKAPLWDAKAVHRRWREFQRDKAPFEHPFWTVLSLQAWLREYGEVTTWT